MLFVSTFVFCGECLFALLVRDWCNGRPCRTDQVYEELFEGRFLRETEDFYAAEGVRYMATADVPHFLQHVEERLQQVCARSVALTDAMAGLHWPSISYNGDGCKHEISPAMSYCCREAGCGMGEDSSSSRKLVLCHVPCERMDVAFVATERGCGGGVCDASQLSS